MPEPNSSRLSISPDALQQARSAGYSDDEIVSFLSARRPEQFKAAQDAGYSSKEVLEHLSGGSDGRDQLRPNPSGIAHGLQQGIANVVQGTGETAKQFLGTDNSGFENAAHAIAPKNYTGAQVVPEGGHWYDPTSYNYRAIPQALAEQAPGIATSLVAARTAAKLLGPKAGLVAGVGSMLLPTLGRSAKEDAAIRTGNPNAEPELQDKARAVATGLAQSVPAAVGIGRFLPSAVRAATGVGATGSINAVRRALTTAGIEAASAGAQDAINQVGSTVGTDRGIQFDPNHVANAAVVGGVGGGLLAAPGAASAAARATALRKFGGDSHSASEAVANRISAAAEGRKFGTDAEPLRTVAGDIKAELNDAVANVVRQKALSPTALSALRRGTEGRPLTDTDLSNVRDAVGIDPTGEQVMQLVRQANVMARLKDQGALTDGKFIGGISSLPTIKHVLSRPITAIAGPAIGFGLGASQGLGGLVAHPGTIAGLVAGYTGLRGLDALTGARAPAQRFVDAFANTSTPVRPVVSTGSPEPPVDQHTQGPWGQRPPQPSVPQVQPQGLPEPVEPSLRQTLRANASIEEGMAKIAAGIASAKRKAFVSDAQPLLRELAAQRKATAPEVPSPSIVPDSVAPEPQAASGAPVFTRLNRKLGGKLTMEQPQDEGYAPIPESKLWRKSLTDDEVATRELANYRPAVQAKYHGNVVSTRKAKFDLLHGFADERIESNTSDARIAGLLYHQLDHISRRSVARQAIGHYAAMMTPEGAAELRALFTAAKMRDLWTKE